MILYSKMPLILMSISISVLLVYGLDVNAELNGENFIPMDASLRGIIFGGLGSILPIVSYSISRKKPSTILGLLIMINGMLIVIGITLVLGITEMEQNRFLSFDERLRSFGPAMILGSGISILGLWKILKDR